MPGVRSQVWNSFPFFCSSLSVHRVAVLLCFRTEALRQNGLDATIEKNIWGIWRSYYFPFYGTIKSTTSQTSGTLPRSVLTNCIKLNGRGISTPPHSSIKPCDKDGVIVPDGRRLSVRSPWQMQSRLWSSAFGPAPPPETERLINTDGGRLALAPPQLSSWISPVSSTIMSVCVWRLTNGNLLRDDKGTC